jgi:hypothetical protein
MHAGSITNPKSQPGILWRYLQRHGSITLPTILRLCRSGSGATLVSQVRQSVRPLGYEIVNEVREKRGEKQSVYRLVRAA